MPVAFEGGSHEMTRPAEARILKAPGNEDLEGHTLSEFITLKNEREATRVPDEAAVEESTPDSQDSGVQDSELAESVPAPAGDVAEPDGGSVGEEAAPARPANADPETPTPPSFDTGRLKDPEYVRTWEAEHGKPIAAEVHRYWANTHRLQSEAAKAARSNLEAKLAATAEYAEAAETLKWFENHEMFPVVKAILDPKHPKHAAVRAQLSDDDLATYEERALDMLTAASGDDGVIDTNVLARRLKELEAARPAPQAAAPEPQRVPAEDPAKPWLDWTARTGVDAVAEEANYVRHIQKIQAAGEKFASIDEMFDTIRTRRAAEVKEAMERDDAAESRAARLAPSTKPPRTTSPAAISPDLPRGKTTLSEFLKAKAAAARANY